MTVYKRTGRWNQRDRTSIAFVSQRQASTSSFWDGIKVDGKWAQQRSEIMLHLVEPDDCRSTEFICEVRTKDAQGQERVSISQVGSAGFTPDDVSTQAMQPATQGCSSALGTLQLSAIIQQTFAAVENSIRQLENRVEDRIQTLATRMDDKLAGMDRTLKDLEDKVNSGLSNSHDRLARSGIRNTNDCDELESNLKEDLKNISQLIKNLVPNSINPKQLSKDSSLKDEIFINHLTVALGNQTDDVLSYTQNTTSLVLDTMQDAFQKLETTLTNHREAMGSSRNCNRQEGSEPSLTAFHVVMSPEGNLLCDSHTDGGGWIIIQRRLTGNVDFYRDWDSYKKGFGSLDDDFWLGNEKIHTITNEADHELMVSLKYKGAWKYARYSLFRLGNEMSRYELRLGSYSGTAGDSLDYHRGRKFSTFDSDSDSNPNDNCAVLYSGAWWYGHCHNSNLNGRWGAIKNSGPRWRRFTADDPVTYSEMKIRRA